MRSFVSRCRQCGHCRDLDHVDLHLAQNLDVPCPDCGYTERQLWIFDGDDSAVVEDVQEYLRLDALWVKLRESYVRAGETPPIQPIRTTSSEIARLASELKHRREEARRRLIRKAFVVLTGHSLAGAMLAGLFVLVSGATSTTSAIAVAEQRQANADLCSLLSRTPPDLTASRASFLAQLDQVNSEVANALAQQWHLTCGARK